MPPDAEFGKGNTVGFGKNKAQQWLWDCWMTFGERVKKVAGRDKYILVVNGDATEGSHHHTTELVAADKEDHTNMALTCLRPLSKGADRTLVTLGTECHTRGMEKLLAEKLGAQGETALAKWLFRICGVLCDATHHMGVTSRAHLEATQMSVTITNVRSQAIRAGHQVAKVFLRGHRHCGGWYADGDSMLCVTGGWQMLTRHGYKVVPDSICRPSGIILDWRDRPDGSLPTVHECIYNPPQPKILVV